MIHVQAPTALIGKRLRERHREAPAQIETRLARINTPVVGKKVVPFDNSREMNETGRLFIRLLEYLIGEKGSLIRKEAR